MPIEVETNDGLSSEKYPAKLTVAGETEYLTFEELTKLFSALFALFGYLDHKKDREAKTT